jgi:YidC/Oxa1 family membrane protein insertase
MEKNAILAAALSIAVLVGWEYFYIRPLQEKNLKQQLIAKKAAAEKPKSPLASAPLVGSAPDPEKKIGKPAAVAPPVVAPAAVEKRVRIDVGAAVYEFTNRGAALVSARLRNYLDDAGKKPIELIVGASSLISPLYFMGDAAADKLNGATYQIEGFDQTLTRSNPEGRLRFLYRDATGLSAEKTFIFRHGSYSFAADFQVERPGSKKPIGLAWGPRLGGSDGNTYGGVIEGPMTFAEKLNTDAPEKDKPIAFGEDMKWTALQTKYFVAALVPRSGAGGAEVRLLEEGKKENSYAVIVPFQGAPKSSAAFDIYVGPKEVDLLAKLDVNLEDALDYGMFSFIAKPLMFVLRLAHTIFGNWGIAIIILTILIKVVFYPLTQVSMRNMKNMQKLQPKMTQIREIYKDDKNRINQEVMALYKEYKVNPMMGCLPMIIQIPVFFGLYNALLVSIELRQAPFFWWITDLSKQDPFHVFTILMGASMFLQQKMTPMTGDPNQAKMMMFMPVIFTGMFIYYPVPVGLVIYWFVNNALSIIQQYFVNKSVVPPKLAEES